MLTKTDRYRQNIRDNLEKGTERHSFAGQKQRNTDRVFT